MIYKIIFGVAILILISLFTYRLLKKDYIENLTAQFELRNGNDFQDDRFQVYNQNSGEPWKELPVESNNPLVQSYGISYNDMYKMNQYIFTDFEKKDIDDFVKQYSKVFEFKKDNYLVDYTPFDIYNMNKDTWFDKFNWDPNYVLYQKYIESKFPSVNKMNMLLLMLFNQFFYKYIQNYVKRNIIQAKPYFILKYRILNVYTNKEDSNNKVFEVITVVTRDDAKLAFEFYLVGDFTGSELTQMSIKYIASYSLDKVLLRQGLDKHNLHYNLNPTWSNDNSYSSSEVGKVYSKGKEKNLEEKNALENSYVCFSYDKESKDPYAQPIYAIDRNDCENQYTIMGYKKPAGAWDRPCKTDSECMFYGQNKNYENNYGKCYRGYCEFPVNMKPMGYHYYINEKPVRPLCYNCKSKKWLPNTQVDFCCEEQKDRKKYPFLKSPDYAFKGDGLTRYNYFIKQNCTMKPNFDNIFDKPEVWKVNCKGFLDTYLLDKGDVVEKKEDKNFDIENTPSNYKY